MNHLRIFGADVSRCGETDCRGLLRPNVVFFGETLDSHILTKVEKEMETCDLCLVVSHPHARHILLLCNVIMCSNLSQSLKD